MNFALDKNNFNINHLYVMEPVNNNVIENGTFHRVIYSNSHMTLNSLVFKLTFTGVNLQRTFNKYKLTIDMTNYQNQLEINYLRQMEQAIIDNFQINQKAQYALIESIRNDNIKLYTEKEIDLVHRELTVFLKISGIWINEDRYGLTYKFLC